MSLVYSVGESVCDNDLCMHHHDICISGSNVQLATGPCRQILSAMFDKIGGKVMMHVLKKIMHMDLSVEIKLKKFRSDICD